MDQQAMMYSELVFNGLYLAVIWWIVVGMGLKVKHLNGQENRIARYFFYAFFLLAVGDTGHVGFRLVAYLMGDLGSTVSVLGFNLPLVGAGALSTAITVTFFYMYLVVIWKIRFGKKTWGAYLGLQLLAVLRLIIMMFPQNQWENVVPPSEWSLYRNLPLTLIGIGLATHILLSNMRIRDRFYTWLAILVYASFFFYLPVVLYIQKVPLLGMLMIPKTIAYVLMAYLAYRKYFAPIPDSRTK